MSLKKLNYIFIRHASSDTLSPTMRAWQIYKYGDISDLRLTNSYRTPVIRNPDQVLVKVNAASINPIDISIISGYGASTFNMLRKCRKVNEFPKTLGRDFCGTVMKTGRSVTSFTPGMQVIGALWPFEEGSHADYLICNQSQLALKPQKLSCTDAAALPYAGLTAYSALVDYGCLKVENATDRKILILGSSGGVGTIALQLAKSWGSYVAVTCREDSEDLLMELGADAIHCDDIGNSSQTYDIIFDCIGDDFEANLPYLKSGTQSRYITIKHSLLKLSDQYSPYVGFPLAGIDIVGKTIRNYLFGQGGIYQWAFFRSSGANLSVISNLVDKGLIIPVVYAQYKFEDTPEAYRCLQSGWIKGKVVIEMN